MVIIVLLFSENGKKEEMVEKCYKKANALPIATINLLLKLSSSDRCARVMLIFEYVITHYHDLVQ